MQFLTFSAYPPKTLKNIIFCLDIISFLVFFTCMVQMMFVCGNELFFDTKTLVSVALLNPMVPPTPKNEAS